MTGEPESKKLEEVYSEIAEVKRIYLLNKGQGYYGEGRDSDVATWLPAVGNALASLREKDEEIARLKALVDGLGERLGKLAQSTLLGPEGLRPEDLRSAHTNTVADGTKGMERGR